MKDHQNGCTVTEDGICTCLPECSTGPVRKRSTFDEPSTFDPNDVPARPVLTLTTCEECGALISVGREDKHAEWHDKLNGDHEKIWRTGLE